MSMASVLVLPGYGDSGPDHWQSRWEAADTRLRRVRQRDWLEPRLDEWLTTLEGEVAACAAPPVLAAHSLGCVLVAHWAGRTARRVRGALLVAPVDVDVVADLVGALETFRPVPLAPLPFPSIVVASDDDAYTTRPRAEAFAQAWGSRFVCLAGAGHINSESGHGDWPEGRALLEELVRGAAAGR
jgi:predicted alpha/beta hydrolase family esterase